MTSDELSHAESLVPFRGSITNKQFSLVQKTLLPWWARAYVVVPCAIYLFVSTGIGWQPLFTHPSKALPDVFYAIVTLLLCWAIVVYGRNRAWRRNSELNGEVTGHASEAGIEWNTALSSSKFPWSKLTKMKEVSKLLLVYYSPRCALYFPKEFFSSEEQWAAFKSLLATKLPRK